jgi:hypothetical protein
MVQHGAEVRTPRAADRPSDPVHREDLRAKDCPVRDDDVARLSPLGHAHLNCLGRYAFTTRTAEGLRPLRDPTTRDDADDEL